MQTLIFFGAARKNGHAKQMLDLFCKHLDGGREIIDAYRETNIAPCKDCRYCWKVRECAIKDDMQKWYKKIDESDRIVIASPIYFHSFPGPLKVVFDRLQVYWASKVRRDREKTSPKHGAILMVGGAPEYKNQFLGAQLTAEGVLADLNAHSLGTVCMPNSDHDSLTARPDIAKQIIALAEQMNKTN